MATTATLDTHIGAIGSGTSLTLSFNTSAINRLAVLSIANDSDVPVGSVSSALLTWTRQNAASAATALEIWTAPVSFLAVNHSVSVAFEGNADVINAIVDTFVLTSGNTNIPFVSAAAIGAASGSANVWTGAITTENADDHVIAYGAPADATESTAGSGYTLTGAALTYLAGEIANAYTGSPGVVSPTFANSTSGMLIGAIALNDPSTTTTTTTTTTTAPPTTTSTTTTAAPPTTTSTTTTAAPPTTTSTTTTAAPPTTTSTTSTTTTPAPVNSRGYAGLLKAIGSDGQTAQYVQLDDDGNLPVDVGGFGGNENYTYGRFTATDTAASVVAANELIKIVRFYNLDASNVYYIGDSSVTAANGSPVFPNSYVTFGGGVGGYYAVTASGISVDGGAHIETE